MILPGGQIQIKSSFRQLRAVSLIRCLSHAILQSPRSQSQIVMRPADIALALGRRIVDGDKKASVIGARPFAGDKAFVGPVAIPRSKAFELPPRSIAYNVVPKYGQQPSIESFYAFIHSLCGSADEMR